MDRAFEEFILSRVLSAETRGARHECAPLPTGRPDRWIHGWHFRGIMSDFRGTYDTPVPGAFLGDSLQLRANGRKLELGVDFELDAEWGAATRTKEQTTAIRADYDFRMLRVDTLVAAPDGTLSLLEGKSHLSNPFPPLVPSESRSIANVFVPYDGAPQIIPILERPVAATNDQLGLLPRTTAKLRSGSQLRITCWGDSVTVGGSSSSTWSSFPGLLQAHLSRANHSATVGSVAVGGTNTMQWLDSSNPLTQLDEVRDTEPDLIILEFVNDAEMETQAWPRLYAEIATRAAEWGSDLLLMTPHFTRPDWMGRETMDNPDRRPYVAFLRDFASRHQIALADASRAWERLWLQGLPYLTLLRNGINHPDDRGHAIYAREICAALGVTVPAPADPLRLDMRD